jgi:hypothetical protein
MYVTFVIFFFTAPLGPYNQLASDRRSPPTVLAAARRQALALRTNARLGTIWLSF